MLRKLDQSVMPRLLNTHRLEFVSVCTPLAPGADTILTEAVLERLRQARVDHRLIVLRSVPVSTVIEQFEASFSDEDEWRLMDSEPTHDRSEVKKQMADHLAKIPLSVPETYVADLTPPGLTIDHFQDDEEQRTRAYRRVGAWLAERSDILIAFHDPKRVAGQGGTGETLGWALGETSIPPDLSTLNPGEQRTEPRVTTIEP